MARSKAVKLAGAKGSGSPAKELAPRRRPLGRRRAQALIALGVVALLAWGGQLVWRRVSPSIVGRDRYLLPAEAISVTQPPEWIVADVRGQVIYHAGLDRRLSILDPGFVEAVRNAFALHPWVESVGDVAKSYPPAVNVELCYRRPVAVVEAPHGETSRLLPVDVRGVHLPAEDVPLIRRQYLPRITGIVGQPPQGQRWDDPRVAGGVELAVLLADVWEPLHLKEISPSARPEIHGDRQFFTYELVTQGGTHVLWGAAPQARLPGEADFAVKLQRLERCVQQYGPLDSVKAPGTVNVRGELEVKPRLVKKPAAAGETEKVVK